MDPDGQTPKANELAAGKRLALLCAGWMVLVVASLVLIYQVIGHLLAPKIYYASVTILFNTNAPGGMEALHAIDTKASFVFSPKILVPVIQTLELDRIWGHRFEGSDFVLKLEDAYQILSARTGVYKNRLGLLTIATYSSDEKEAIQLANSIAYSCRNYFQKTNSSPPISFADALATKISRRRSFRSIFWWSITAQFVGLGFVMVRWGSKMPRPVLTPQIPATAPLSKY